MNEAKLIEDYEQLKQRANAVGLTIKTDFNDQFSIADAPGSNGLVCFKSLNDLNNFIYGYELGYKSGL